MATEVPPVVSLHLPAKFVGPWESIKAQYDAEMLAVRRHDEARSRRGRAAEQDFEDLVKQASDLGITSVNRTYGPSDETQVKISRTDLRILLESFPGMPPTVIGD